MLNDFLNAYKEFWIKATDFKGFTSRSDWWLVQLANIIISFLTIPIFLKTFGFNAYGIVCIIPQIAIDLRRISSPPVPALISIIAFFLSASSFGSRNNFNFFSLISC